MTIRSRRRNLSLSHLQKNRKCYAVLPKEALIADLSILAAAHLGPGAVGIVAYPVEEV